MANGYYGTSESASTAAMILVAEAEAYAAAAKLSEDAAEVSEINAAASAVVATDASANVAAGVIESAASASAALISEGSASSSATAASTSATNAAASETAASNSATAAATSETNASTSAATATTKASEASTSATASAASATSASASATSATASAATATTKASEASTSATQAASSATSGAASATAASNSATAAATSETNSAASATSASNSATAAATSETNAQASETSAAADAAIATAKALEASTSASEAATSATSAGSSATSATASATTATTKASEASTSEVNAAASAASSAASYDDFDDRYLGAKATDPTVDNDGNAIITGALYFNTTDDVMKVYEGVGWVAAYASLSGAAMLTGADFTGTVSAPDFIGPLNGPVQFTGKNTSGVTINEGQAIGITGISGNTPEVGLADADNLATMPAFGLAGSTASNNQPVEIITFGSLKGIKTNYTGWALGDTLYISTTAGVLTNVAPSGEASKIQNIGTVERLHSSNGTIKVGGAGRTNATPNLNDGNFFLGNASNQSVTASFSNSVTGIALPLAGGALTGAVTTTSTFDGRDVSVDGSKLDGGLAAISNVPSDVWASTPNKLDIAAVGLIGSEGGYRTSWTWNGYRNNSGGFTYRGVNGNTTTASNLEHDSSALVWKAGVASGTILPEIMRVTSAGNLTLSGTVDGRDVSADGTKLDTIATSANNYSFPYTVRIGATGNTVALRNGNADIFSRFLNATGTFSTAGGSSGMVNFTGTNGSDTYGRSYSAAAARSALAVLPLAGGSMTGLIVGRTCTTTTVASANDAGSMSIRGSTTTPATVSFHRAGAYAVNFGLSTANKMELGGWSAGGIKHTWDMSGNYTAVGSVSSYGNFVTNSNNSIWSASINTTVMNPAYGYLQMLFMSNGSDTGTITSTATSTSYNTSSDYRLKENVTSITNASSRVQQLKPCNFDWINGGANADGFLAHELAEVIPEATVGEKDGTKVESYVVTPAIEEVRDSENNITQEGVAEVTGERTVPAYQGIDQSKIVPLLTAALQEALTKIDELEIRLTTLEG